MCLTCITRRVIFIVPKLEKNETPACARPHTYPTAYHIDIPPHTYYIIKS